MMAELYEPGTIVQLRSGGPTLTIGTNSVNDQVTVIYYNGISGLFETCRLDQRCLKPANTAPTAPLHSQEQHRPFKSSLE